MDVNKNHEESIDHGRAEQSGFVGADLNVPYIFNNDAVAEEAENGGDVIMVDDAADEELFNEERSEQNGKTENVNVDKTDNFEAEAVPPLQENDDST
ncbi:unnamed protein product [Linum trigynum]|uniref:Uncharacterized protein n=1 Tax=Linum trigynum TaxID=586398 RepID=A0AAV2GPN4_9ROSI